MEKLLRGFSLVELSIVLVILGLLVGGVLSGQSLIRASELRAVVTEFDSYRTALHAFRDRYFALPGDMATATKFWGVSSACSGSAANGTCDGDGNGLFDASTNAGQSGELFQLWNQLALAGLITGSFTGIAGPNTLWQPGWDSIPGTNVPRSRLSNAGWSIFYQATGGDTATYTYAYGNELIFGAAISGTITEGSALKPEEAWNIDTKVDDGKPGTGIIIARDNGGFGNANSCTTSSSTTDYAGGYNLGLSNLACSFKFINMFN